MKNNLGKQLFKKIFFWYIMVAFLLTSFQIYSQYSHQKKLLHNSLTITQKVFQKAITNSVWNLDEVQMQSNIESIMALNNIVGISIVDQDKSVIIQSGEVVKKDNIISRSFELIKDKDLIASVTLYTSKHLIFSAIKNNIVLILVKSIIKSLILIMLFYYFTNKLITQTVHKLTEELNQMSFNDKKHLHMENIGIADNNELFTLIQSYNSMKDRIYDEIDKNKKAEELLSNQYNLIHNIINSVPMGIFWKDKDGTYLGANKIFLQDTKLACEDDLVGRNDFEIESVGNQAKRYRESDLKVMDLGVAKLNFEESRVNNEDKTIYYLKSKVPLEDKNGNIIGILGSYSDITKQKEMEAKILQQKNTLYHQANHDALTGLPNRALFNDRLKQAIKKAKRNHTKMALFFIDLDHFKEINDSLGHDAGDEILKAVSDKLCDAVRDEDTVARLGGDEFTIILESLTQIQDSFAVAEKIFKSFLDPINVGDNTLYASSSIGISIYPDDGDTATDLLNYADSAMYKAKDEGKNNYQFYNSTIT